MSTPEVAGAFLSGLVILVTCLLWAWQRAERASRAEDLSPEDTAHFRSQETRRGFVAALMVAIAAGIVVGTRMPHQIDGRPNVGFLALWLTICWMVVVLTVLALADLLATRRYARRHRKEMLRQGLRILRDEMRLRMASRDRRGRASGSEPVQLPDPTEGD